MPSQKASPCPTSHGAQFVLFGTLIDPGSWLSAPPDSGRTKVYKCRQSTTFPYPSSSSLPFLVQLQTKWYFPHPPEFSNLSLILHKPLGNPFAVLDFFQHPSAKPSSYLHCWVFLCYPYLSRSKQSWKPTSTATSWQKKCLHYSSPLYFTIRVIIVYMKEWRPCWHVIATSCFKIKI